MYFLEEEGEYLKTKIVATIGEELPGRYDQSGIFHTEVVPYTDFFRWFRQRNRDHLMIDIIRLNMSFYEKKEESKSGEDTADAAENGHQKVFNWLKSNSGGLGKNLAVLGDLPGPKIRLEKIPEIVLEKGQQFRLNFGDSDEDSPEDALRVLINDKPFRNMVKKIDNSRTIEEYISKKFQRGDRVLISVGDGNVILNASRVENNIVDCTVEKEGKIRNKPGVTIIGTDLDVDSFLEQDREALNFLLKNGLDITKEAKNREDFLGYVGVSFVQNVNDILNVRFFIEQYIYKKLKELVKGLSLEEVLDILSFKIEIESNSSDSYGDQLKIDDALKKEAKIRTPLIIAKIETRKAWENIDEILSVADGLMVARGDLALSLSPQEVPFIQKEIIRKCNLLGKPVITATEMLSTMEEKSTPTRAEATDVFNAILDGTTAVMLSGETANGRYPVHAVKTMVKIARKAEEYYRRSHLDENYRKKYDRQRFQEISIGSQSFIAENEERYKCWSYSAASKDSRFKRFIDDDSGEEIWWRWLSEFINDLIVKNSKQATIDSISESACILSEEKQYSAIIVSSLTGRTAKMIARFHPSVRIIPTVHAKNRVRKLILSYGSTPINIGRRFNSLSNLIEKTIEVAKSENQIKSNEEIIFIASTPLWTLGEANLIQIQKVR
jgi:pyruvate kinase